MRARPWGDRGTIERLRERSDALNINGRTVHETLGSGDDILSRA